MILPRAALTPAKRHTTQATKYLSPGKRRRLTGAVNSKNLQALALPSVVFSSYGVKGSADHSKSEKVFWSKHFNDNAPRNRGFRYIPESKDNWMSKLCVSSTGHELHYLRVEPQSNSALWGELEHVDFFMQMRGGRYTASHNSFIRTIILPLKINSVTLWCSVAWLCRSHGGADEQDNAMWTWWSATHCITPRMGMIMWGGVHFHSQT